MKKFLFLFFSFITSYSSACICNPILPISKDLCKNYDAIFCGQVDSVSTCDIKDRAIAYFTITDLYKGNVSKHVKISFDCNTECLMSFAKGEEWIIYSTYEKFDMLTVFFCGHSRKKFGAEALDIYLLSAQKTFEKEKEFLKTTLGIQDYIEENSLNVQHDKIGSRNEQPSNWGKLTLLFVSLIAMGIIYYITRKKK